MHNYPQFMYRLHHLILIAFGLIFFASCVSNNKTDRKQIINPNWKKISDAWIDKALHFGYKKDTTLLTGFAEQIKPDTIHNPHAKHLDPEYGFVFNPISVDLDGDHINELLCMLGWDVYSPSLCVFKQVDNNWYLIYTEDIDTFNSSPALYVANNFSPNKTFYLCRSYGHGSGTRTDGYCFYKLVDNKVYRCLNIISDTRIYGWGLYMNQVVKSKIEFSNDSEDELWVQYDYNFFPGSINQGDFSWNAHEDISLIKGEDDVRYTYNPKEHQYKLKIESYKRSADDLTAEKIACFGDFGNDSLFVKAYRRHIDTVIKTGTPLQRKILKKYLSLAAKENTVTTEILEMKSKTGGTTFYGPAK